MVKLPFFRLSIACLSCASTAVLLTACGGGSGDSSDTTSQDSTTLSAEGSSSGDTSRLTAASFTTRWKHTDKWRGAPAPASLVSYQQLADDMAKSHESTVHGIDPAWSWGTHPRLGVGVNFPSGYDDPQFVPWGIAGSATSGSPATNTRVQLRKIILDVKRNGTWSRIVYNTSDSQIMGSLYTNYETNATAPANLRNHGTDGISVKLPSTGGSFHFMTTNRFPVAFGAQEIVSRVEARLIVDDATKPDDRASAKLLVGSGGDIWRNATAQWDPDTLSNVDFAIGRFKFVNNNWAIFSSHTLGSDVELNDYLTHEPNLTPR